MTNSVLKDCSVIDVAKFSSSYFGSGKKAKAAADSWLRKLSRHQVMNELLFT